MYINIFIILINNNYIYLETQVHSPASVVMRSVEEAYQDTNIEQGMKLIRWFQRFIISASPL